LPQKFPTKIFEPDEETRKEIYKLYKVIFNSKLGDKRNKLMTYIFAWHPWSWRVVAISRGAFDNIRENDFFPLPKKIVRDHFLQDRNVTYKKMLESDKPYEFEHWWNLFWDNDQTIIMTKDEHDNARDEVKCHQINWEDGYFSCNPLIGFKYRKSIEGSYLKGLTEGNWVSVKTIKEIF
jgi:hypothetical protein